MTVAMLGGVILVIGAYFVFKGEVFKSVFAYFIADIIWVILAINAGDIVGAAFIFVGATFGFMAFLKMRSGEFNKTIKKV